MQVVYNNSYIDVKKGTRVNELLKDAIKNANKPIIACMFNNELKSLNYEINTSGEIKLVDVTQKDGMRVYKRGLIYIVGKAFQELYPEALLTINYQLYHSMFCDVENLTITDEMIENISKKVKEIVDRDIPITKRIMTKDEARDFYEKEKTLKGILQLDLEAKKEVTLYYAEDYYNYFYGVMPISTGILKSFDILKYYDGFIIRYPNRITINKIPKLIECPKLFSTLREYDKMHKVLNINTLYKLNKKIQEDRIKDYIFLDEALHEKKIANIADEILERKKAKVVLIAGPSSSGKTTFAKRLEIQLRINGLKPKTISVDNYFVERIDTPKDENGENDYECIESIDTKLLHEHLIKLLNGEEVKLPTFNFKTGEKEYKGNTMKIEEDEILIMEGIHCLNDKLTYLIPKEQKFKIYISCLTVLNIDYYNRISTTDSRLIRRIVRDNQFRGYSAIHTLRMWQSVGRGEAKNIFPYQEEADAMFNSSLIYELSVLKDYAMPLLREITNKEPEFSEAKRLYAMLQYFESIPEEYVPTHSLLREFIGGSIFEEE